MADLIARLAERLRGAGRITVLTGAGVSAPSGVPTFRGADGLWKSHRPESLATPDAFARDPALVWEWYAWRRQKVAACRPNRAHEVLAAWSRRYPKFDLITQNVDGLHELAGTRWHPAPARLALGGLVLEPLRQLSRPLGRPQDPVRRDAAPLLTLRRSHPTSRRLVRRVARSGRPRPMPHRPRLRHLPDDRHLVGRLPCRVARARRQAARGVDRRDQPRGDTRVRCAGPVDSGAGRGCPRRRRATARLRIASRDASSPR